MLRARRFTFGPYTLDIDRSTISYTYYVDLEEGGRETYTDIVEFPGATRDMWSRIPQALLTTLLENLCLVIGINYWKVHPALSLAIDGFSLTPEQADFWNELYTKGLGEFFYRMKIDFRGLVSFPSKDAQLPRRRVTRFPRSSRILLLNGGGKDSIVSAEMLKAHKMPFELFTVNPTDLHLRVAGKIGRGSAVVVRRQDPTSLQLRRSQGIPGTYPSVSTFTFMGAIVAALYDYGYIVFSDESSADIGNTTYLGMEVNHQWSKSSESEQLINNYIARFITPDIKSFSLVRQFTEIEMTRRFAAYPDYFFEFQSCNVGFNTAHTAVARKDRVRWCARCPKCIFIFASLAAFLPKDTVVDIFGADLHADAVLIPTYRQLLGLEGFKPFECVGAPEEMITALYRAQLTGAYEGEPAMELFAREVSQSLPFSEIEARVLAPQNEGAIPETFAHAFKTPR